MNPVLRLRRLFDLRSWQGRVAWVRFGEGVEMFRLYGDGRTGPTAALIRFAPGGRVPYHEHAGYEHILVLHGSQVDQNGEANAGTLLVHPPGSAHSVRSDEGCLVLAIYEQPVRFREEPAPGSTPAPAWPVVDWPASTAESDSGENDQRVRLAVNGTLMRGLELNPNLIEVGARFEFETATEPSYRLWSIRDRHPAMVRVATGGVAVVVEVWSVPPAGLATILLREPPGLSIGKVRLADGSEVLGVLGEPALCEGMREITEFGGWRAYVAAGKKQ